MKRKEAAHVLSNIIRYHLTCSSNCCQTDEDLANKVLTEIQELIGMKPPTLPEDYCQAIAHVYYAGYSYNQWEEDIVKDEKVMEAYNKRRKND